MNGYLFLTKKEDVNECTRTKLPGLLNVWNLNGYLFQIKGEDINECTGTKCYIEGIKRQARIDVCPVQGNLKFFSHDFVFC